MQIEIPDGMSLFAWTCGDAGTFLIVAPDQDTAYERAIWTRMQSGLLRTEAEAWFERNDALVEIDLLERGDGTIR